MFSAQILHAGSSVYSPWMPRGGDYLRATLDMVDRAGSETLDVDVFTKNREDTGSGTSVGTTITGGAAGRTTAEMGPSVFKELVRYKFTASSGDWVMFRMLTPIWFNAVTA